MDTSPAPFWEQQRQARLQQLHFHDIALADLGQRTIMRDQLLRDVDALTSLAQVFKSYVNQTSFVSRLPAELMMHIFRLLADVDHPSPYSLGWVCASHVCRSWRETLLGARDLWAEEIGTIPYRRPISTFLRRAGDDIPLRISVQPSNIPQALAIWMGAYDLPLWRAHTISWEIRDREDIEPFLENFAAGEWPALKRLETEVYDCGEEPHNYKFPNAEPFCAPNLREWTSRSLYIPVRAHSMVTLDLNGMMLEAAGLLEILAYAPLLENVRVTESAVNDDTDLRDRLHASLHHLRTFELHCNNMTGDELNRAVVSHIDLPNSAGLDLFAEYMDENFDFELLVTIARNVWPRHIPLSVTISRAHLTLRASGSSGYQGYRTMSFENLQCLEHAMPFLMDALNPELERVDHLIVSFRAPFESAEQMWSLVKSMLPAVERLDVIEGEDLDDLIEIGEAFTEPPEYMFPRLHHLRIAQSFLHSKNGAVLIGLDGVHELLRDRIPNGAGPNELWLEGLVEPGRDDVDANVLRALVPNIHWAKSVEDGEV
ncbi:hypothetical protein PENSPDRAFT_685830 [Peniophora sp. CONT]|nr:hypothetical protein PENSPDRAFT_685830 [Peniophora sp. CONT]